MTRGVHIHAGAHRTGTSSFQLFLSENREALRAQGFDAVYPGRDGAPGGRLRLPLPRPRHGEKRVDEYARAIRKHLAVIAPDEGRDMVMSEENITGPMHHFVEGQFYPASAKRIQSLAGALREPPAHILFVVRPYEELYASAWRKRAEDNLVEPFADHVEAYAAMDRGWPALVKEFRDLMKPARLTVLDYAHRGTNADLLARLVSGLDFKALREPESRVNLSATDAGLAELQARYRAGEKLDREGWQAVIAAHAEDWTSRGLTDYPARARAILRVRYTRDLDRLAAMPGISFERAGAAA